MVKMPTPAPGPKKGPVIPQPAKERRRYEPPPPKSPL
jgi:hypothetical protein